MNKKNDHKEEFIDVESYEEILYEDNSDLKKVRKVKRPNRKNKFIIGGLLVAILSFTGGLATNNIISNLKDKDTSNLSYKSKPKDEDKKTETQNDESNSSVNNDVKKDSNNEKMDIEDIVKNLSPAVVTVSVKNQGNMFEQASEGVGTGFIVDENGTIVTNNHVIEGASDISVIFSDGTETKVNIVSVSKEDDIAVLKVIDNIKMPGVAKLASDDIVNSGQEIITIGNPLGKNFSGTVTKGIVSSPKRKVNSDGIEKEFIQIDAAINPGNSGGPLINLYGEVIGVNTAKQTGENVEGIGFSVPIKEVRKILNNPEQYSAQNNAIGSNGQNGNQGESYGYNDKNYGNTPNQNEAEVTLGISVGQKEDGVYIADVSPRSIADINGLKVNDKIVSFNNVKINSINELGTIVSSLRKGDSVSIVIERGNKKGRIDMQV